MSETIAGAGSNTRAELARSMALAASEFLASLTHDQIDRARWPFPSTDERERWFYTPTDHGGLPLVDMRADQQRLAFRLVSSGLSRAGYVTVMTIVGLDNVLDELEGWIRMWSRDRGRDPGLYYLRIFGDPSENKNWSWRFGGHHVSLNHTVINGEVQSVTPNFLGADPASSPLLGPHPLRPLAGAEDLARELLHSLSSEQRMHAYVSDVAPVDLVGANRSRISNGDLPLPLSDVWRGQFDGDHASLVRAMQTSMETSAGLQAHHLEAVRFTAIPKGISVARFDVAQKKQFRDLLDTYVRRMPDALAELEAAKFDGDRLDALSFLWAGGMQPGEGHYYRIQGARLVVEYDNSARGANHVHTVWRDLEGDFAADVLGDHYRADH
jgi:Protein of unknown function (DUF3500)